MEINEATASRENANIGILFQSTTERLKAKPEKKGVECLQRLNGNRFIMLIIV